MLNALSMDDGKETMQKVIDEGHICDDMPKEEIISIVGNALADMLDLKDLPYLEIQVSRDGTKVWLNTEEKCIVRIQNIGTFINNDLRSGD